MTNFELTKVHLDSGGYDSSGRYWGAVDERSGVYRLYRVILPDDTQHYFRARNRTEAQTYAKNYVKRKAVTA
jgi:two-component SAPR family response regulator